MNPRSRIGGVLAYLAFSALGCGRPVGQPEETGIVGVEPAGMATDYDEYSSYDKASAARAASSATDSVSGWGDGTASESANGVGAVPPGIDRRIVYNADVRITVGDFDRAAGRIAELIRSHGGYVAESEVSGSPGSNRSGRWKARVPIAEYDGFLDDVVAIGELDGRRSDSQDVTEEYYDLEARIANKRVEEDRMVELLKNTAGELKEILEVERELSRVREEAERMVGRQRLLADMSALTTVTISVSERTEYIPAAAPGFGARIARAFEAANRQFVETVQGVLVGIVRNLYGLLAWSLALLIGLLIARAAFVRLRRRTAPGSATATGPGVG